MLSKPIRYLKGVGPRVAEKLARLNIFTTEDLLFFSPRRYEDWQHPLAIAHVLLAEEPTVGQPLEDRTPPEIFVEGKIEKSALKKMRPGWSLLTATVKDKTGEMEAIWFNQPFLVDILRVGVRVLLRGKIERGAGKIQLHVHEYHIFSEDTRPTILSYYSLTAGITDKRFRLWMRAAMESARGQLQEVLPNIVYEGVKLLPRSEALTELHFPSSLVRAEEATHRFAFEELLILQLALLLRKAIYQERVAGISFTVTPALRQKFLESLPFTLTESQFQVLLEVEGDMSRARPMNRLLQGDVGSGKTVIAAYAAFLAAQSGYQVAILVPTEILAEQHVRTFERFLAPHKIPVHVITGSVKKRDAMYQKMLEGAPMVLVGTHALLEEKVIFGKLGLVVIDEQHRFGVVERAKIEKKGKHPDLLVMTATPIPRTLALSVYGDLDQSAIVGRPPGRKEVRTYFVPEGKRAGLNNYIQHSIGQGGQVFVVCPLVEESQAADLKAAKQHAVLLQSIFKPFHIQVGLLHGRMKSEEKQKVMDRFRSGETDLLVATTVIEVGVDVPAASLMVVEHAERFGLSQLHQLRGRIGRGEKAAECFLMASPKSETARKRIQAMVKYHDGFRLAEMDLLLRGPGELQGLRQSGLPEFRFADILRDVKMLSSARKVAQSILERDPSLRLMENIYLRQEVLKKYKSSFQLGRLQ